MVSPRRRTGRCPARQSRLDVSQFRKTRWRPFGFPRRRPGRERHNGIRRTQRRHTFGFPKDGFSGKEHSKDQAAKAIFVSPSLWRSRRIQGSVREQADSGSRTERWSGIYPRRLKIVPHWRPPGQADAMKTKNIRTDCQIGGIALGRRRLARKRCLPIWRIFSHEPSRCLGGGRAVGGGKNQVQETLRRVPQAEYPDRIFRTRGKLFMMTRWRRWLGKCPRNLNPGEKAATVLEASKALVSRPDDDGGIENHCRSDCWRDACERRERACRKHGQSAAKIRCGGGIP